MPFTLKQSGANSPAARSDAIISHVIADTVSPDLLLWLAGTTHASQSPVIKFN